MSPSAPREEPPAVEHRGRRTALGVVFTTILIDFIGFSVLIPVLPLYAEQLGASSFEVGLLLSLYALAQLVFLPAWGWVSDRMGRRPIILVSLLGTAFSFVMLALAHSLAMIYLARVVGGFFAASIGTAQAVVTDLTPASERARGMGLIGAAFGLGFVVGNALGGLLAAVHPRAPFYAIAALALANLAVAWIWLPESHPEDARPKDRRGLGRALIPAPLRLVAALHDRRIGLYLYLFFHIFTAFAALESMLALFMHQRFGLGPRDVGFVFAYIGVFIALTQGLLVGQLASRLGEIRLVVIGLAATGIGLLAISLVPAYGWLYVVGPFIAFGNGIAFPAFTSLYSKACHSEKAGELLGESQSMATAGRIVGPAWAGLALGHVALGAPFAIAGVLMLIALAVFLRGRPTLLGRRA